MAQEFRIVARREVQPLMRAARFRADGGAVDGDVVITEVRSTERVRAATLRRQTRKVLHRPGDGRQPQSANQQLQLDRLSDQLQCLLASEGFSSVEEVAFVEPAEIASIEGFDEETAAELQQRANDHLAQIDAPEMNQPWGPAAKAALNGLSLGDSIAVRNLSARAGPTRGAQASVTGALKISDIENPLFNLGLTARNFNVLNRAGFADLDVNGSEAGFNCALTARTRTSSALSPSDLRQLESDLRSRLDFVYGASEAMNYLERLGSLDWGILDCRKPEAGPVDEAERAQREARAKEKMLREIERRRARQRADD